MPFSGTPSLFFECGWFSADISLSGLWSRSRRGCDEALFNEKQGLFSEKGGGNSVNEGFGKDFYRKGNSVKRSGRFSEPPDSEKWKIAVLIPFPKISSYGIRFEIWNLRWEKPGEIWGKDLSTCQHRHGKFRGNFRRKLRFKFRDFFRKLRSADGRC